MKIANTHLSYCTNIHGGESWDDHFRELQTYVPLIKAEICPDQSFGLGLRLSAQASQALIIPDNLAVFKSWLQENNVYIFTMNGFPYGDFHLKEVKDKVHFPDWTTGERLNYTLNLFDILAQLIPQNEEGGISTSPLSYRFWFEEGTAAWQDMKQAATLNIVKVAEYLYLKEHDTGRYMHLDIEPEPDGVIENAAEFIHWYQEELLTSAQGYFKDRLGLNKEDVKVLINRYICLCYDVCHFALAYAEHAHVMDQLADLNIKIGKFQISSALKVDLLEDTVDRLAKKEVLKEFDEPIYLHQVIARKKDGTLVKYRDLPQALPHIDNPQHVEWRSHFHVPIFLAKYAEVASTQQDILEVLALHNKHSRTNHIEVETYTWGVLPKSLQASIESSISRELQWLLDQIEVKS
ncbi:metabolite traffic protein EboE [Sphingobacterium rhinopitheci]|uniref:metabolite traffic protein EboE n=1 Tax=Sphingobacterium rhinopitheci TaxID=2781960 RepID=UPI001F515D6B|nr:metabolite traffic protein EboE [Sphingobacterium rhinopitheci]MCI0920909.1 metabolite traffic protein EboE [Sphingobacterium rhinopitheci]